jgi:hypothetical protein
MLYMQEPELEKKRWKVEGLIPDEVIGFFN